MPATLRSVQLPELSVLRVVVQRYAEVLAALKLTASEQPLILPTNYWFPDTFKGDQDSFERLVARMQGYAGLEDTEIEAVLVGAEGGGAACGTGGCGTGGCGTPKEPLEGPRLSLDAGVFRIEFPATAVHHPIALTAGVARSLGQIRLLTAGHAKADAAASELAAVALGFGVLLLEASYLYSKSCGGPSVGTATALPCGELALPFALFVAHEGHKLRKARAELSTTQRAVVEEAWALVDSNRKLVEQLRTRLDRVQQGAFELGEERSLLARWFGAKPKKRTTDPHAAALVALERGESLDSVAALLGSETRPATPAARETRADDDVRSLVDEALQELRGNSASNRERAAE